MERLDNATLEYALLALSTSERTEFDEVVLSALKELQEYREMEINGSLLRLQDEVGTASYLMMDSESIYIICRPDRYKEICKNKYKEWNTSGKKYVFLTQAEAEAKLKEMEGERCK